MSVNIFCLKVTEVSENIRNNHKEIENNPKGEKNYLIVDLLLCKQKSKSTCVFGFGVVDDYLSFNSQTDELTVSFRILW